MHVLDMVLLNSYTFFKVKSDGNIAVPKFSKAVCEQLADEHSKIYRQTTKSHTDSMLNRLVARHFPEYLLFASDKIGHQQRQCNVCFSATKRLPQGKDVTT